MEKIILDKYQKKVIKNKSKNLLVIAAAGSGKTLTIIYKIKNLLQAKIKPEEILCITFTKAACQSLKEKLLKENIIVKVKTFHSLGYEIIKKSANKTITSDSTLDNIILKHLKNCPDLDILINAEFIEFGVGNSKKIKNNILKNSEYILNFKDIIKTFINLFKSNNYNINSFQKFNEINKKENAGKIKLKHQKYLKLVKKIYLSYEEYLKESSQIDFHDMINHAAEIINHEGIYPYKYILIDEYQDTSLNKCELVKAIQNKTKASIIAVGDDWQSIYRFTGSNLEIFTNFKKYFPKAKIIKLKHVYRSSQEILKLSRKFIMKNKHQIDKRTISHKKLHKPVHIYYYEKSVQEIWPKLNTKDALILGRTNKDKNKLPKSAKNFMTVHKSKGLEAERVIITNLENNITGFPCKLQNSEYLNYVIPIKDEYPYAEERRLFYVALTRTKSTVTLLVSKKNPSLFVTELLKNAQKYIEIID